MDRTLATTEETMLDRMRKTMETGESILESTTPVKEKQAATEVVLRSDNPCIGIIQNDSARGLFKKDMIILHRELASFNEGALINVMMEFPEDSPSYIKKIWQHKTQHIDIVKREAAALTVSEREMVLETAKSIAIARRIGMEVVLSEAKLLDIFEDDTRVISSDDTVQAAGVTYFKTKKEQEETVEDTAPTFLHGFYISDETRLIFNTAVRMSKVQPHRAIKVMMVGPSGTGKTTMPRLVAQATGKKFMRMNCASIRDPEEWFGYREAREGSTVFIRSRLMSLLEEGNAVVVLDEFNRIEPWLHNTLYPMLDEDGATVIHDEEFHIGEGVIVVGTINTGYKYTGIFELDEALLNRFDLTLEVGNLPHAEEVKVLMTRTGISRTDASLIAKLGNKVRQLEIACSIRTTLAIAQMMQSGMTMREAFETTIVRRVPSEVNGNSLRKIVTDAINTEIGIFMSRKGFEGDIFKTAITSEKRHSVEVALTHKDPNKVAVISILRSLDMRNDSDEKYEMSYGQAQNLYNSLVKGERITLELYNRPTDLDDFIDKMRTVGLTGQFIYR